MKRIVSGLLAAGLLCLAWCNVAVAAQAPIELSSDRFVHQVDDGAAQKQLLAQMNLLTGAGGKFRAAATPIVFNITYGSEVEDNTSQTTYTLANVGIGSADANRYPVIAVCIRSASAITTPTVTVGGAAATKVIEMITGAGAASYAGLFQVPTAVGAGTSATVVLSSFGAAAARASAAGYSVVTSTSALPSGGAISAASISGTTLTGSVTVPANGRAILAGCVSAVSSSSITAPAANITQDLGKVIGASTTWTNAGHDTVDRTGSTTYTVNYSGVTTSGAGVIAAWAP